MELTQSKHLQSTDVTSESSQPPKDIEKKKLKSKTSGDPIWLG